MLYEVVVTRNHRRVCEGHFEAESTTQAAMKAKDRLEVSEVWVTIQDTPFSIIQAKNGQDIIEITVFGCPQEADRLYYSSTALSDDTFLIKED